MLSYINTYDFDKPQLTWTTDGLMPVQFFCEKVNIIAQMSVALYY